MPFPHSLEIGPADFINSKCIKRAKLIPGTGDWKISGKLIPADDNEWITITAEQYEELLDTCEDKVETERRSQEGPTIRIVT